MLEPIVFIPGLMCDARLFLHQITFIGAHRPVMIALPKGSNSIEDMSLAILATAPPRFALVGHGLGGDVALDMTRRALDRISRIALISTDPLSETAMNATAREARMVAARAGRMDQAMAEELPPSALGNGPLRDEVMQQIADMADALGSEVFVAQSRALQRRPDQQKTMRRAVLPTLIIAGAQDTLVPRRRQEFVAGLMPHATLVVVEDAGHLVPLEQPEAVTAALESFLNGPMLLR